MAKEVFQPTKPHVNVGTIGHIDHGKSTNKERALFLAEKMPKVTVLHGDALHRDLMSEANISQTETVITVTNDDESNILGAVLAKQTGAQRAIALVNGTTYASLTPMLGIDAIVSPRASTLSTIMRRVRRGRIKALHTLEEGQAEVIEAEVSETSHMANHAIEDLDLPQNVRIGAIVSDGSILVPHNDLMIKPHDHVIVLTSTEQVRRVEQMFMVHVDLF